MAISRRLPNCSNQVVTTERPRTRGQEHVMSKGMERKKETKKKPAKTKDEKRAEKRSKKA
jgi:hypothetical protein